MVWALTSTFHDQGSVRDIFQYVPADRICCFARARVRRLRASEPAGGGGGHLRVNNQVARPE